MHVTDDMFRFLDSKLNNEQRKRMAAYTEVRKEPRRSFFSRLAILVPWPPSANRIWRIGNGKAYLSPKYKEFKKNVEAEVRKATGEAPKPLLSGKFDVEITLYPPTRRKRDVDNCVKPILDALTSAGVWRDDEDVWQVLVRRSFVRRSGYAYVVIKPFREGVDNGKSGDSKPV